MEQNSEENAGLFIFLPLELQINIFCFSSVTDLVLFSSTCQYWRLNAWAFIVTLDPAEFQQLVKKVANHASFDPNMALDLFSDAVAPSTQDIQVNQFQVFDFLFERIERSILQVDYFTLDGSLDGWSDIKLDLLGALEKYPGFMKQLKQLKLIHLSNMDLARVLKLARSLEVLDLRAIPDSNYQLVVNAIENKFDNLTSLTMANCNFEPEILIDHRFPKTLRALKFESAAMRYINPRSCFPHLTYLGFVNIQLLSRFNAIPTYLKDNWPNLKVLDVTGTGSREKTSELSVEKLPKYLRKILFRSRGMMAREHGLPGLKLWCLPNPNDSESEEEEEELPRHLYEPFY